MNVKTKSLSISTAAAQVRNEDERPQWPHNDSRNALYKVQCSVFMSAAIAVFVLVMGALIGYVACW